MEFIDSAKNMFNSLWRRISGRVLLESVLDVEERIARWIAIYRGCPAWLPYSYISTAGHRCERERKSLHMAKYVCKELASLVWSENPIIDAGKDSTLEEWLEAQNFFNRVQKFTEYGAAAGGYVMKLRAPESGGLVVDFVPADFFIPVSWDNQGIYEADFISRRVDDRREILAVEQHRRIDATSYQIKTLEYEERGAYLTNEKIVSDVTVRTTVPLFVYVPTPDVNNFDIDSPLGVSIFANAEDTLYSLDVAFDALSQEIILGKRRIIVPVSALRTAIDPKTGKETRYFDPSDEAFVAFNMKDADNQRIIDNTVELRIEELVLAVKSLLDILAMQTGFSAGTFSFDGQTVKTATEVISENAKSFKTKQSFENQIGHGMRQLFKAVREIGAAYGLAGIPEDVSIAWNDAVVEDRASRGKYWNDRYLNGTCSLETALVNMDGLSPEDAAAEAEKIRSGKSTVDVGGLFGQGA